MGFFEHFAQLFGREIHGFFAVPAAQIGMHHVTLDWPRADNRNLDDEVVEYAWFQAWQHGHLRTAFDLEDTDGIGFAQHVVHSGIARGHGGKVDAAAVMLFQQVETLADTAQHSQREHVDLENAERVQVVLVPFDGGAVFHGGIGNGHKFR